MIDNRTAYQKASELFAGADYDYTWRPTEFGDWSTVAYQRTNARRVTQRRTSRPRRRSLNGPVTVRRVAPRA